MQCIQCSKETKNPKFCSRSCSATYYNHVAPKRIKRGTIKNCVICDKPLSHRHTCYCSHECYSTDRWNKRLQEINTTGILHPKGHTHSSKLAHKYLAYIQGEFCSICKQPPVWNNKPMILIVDHINGICDDWRIENIRLVCPNCDTQLPTFKSRNKNSKRKHRHTIKI